MEILILSQSIYKSKITEKNNANILISSFM